MDAKEIFRAEPYSGLREHGLGNGGNRDCGGNPSVTASPCQLLDAGGSRRKRITRNTAVGATLAVALVGRGRKPEEAGDHKCMDR